LRKKCEKKNKATPKKEWRCEEKHESDY